MTQQQFIDLCQKPEIPMDIWYEYFLERGGSRIGLNMFEEVFTKFLAGGVTQVITPTKTRYVSFKIALDNFYHYYQQKFNL